MPLEDTQVRPILPKRATGGILPFLLSFQHLPVYTLTKAQTKPSIFQLLLWSPYDDHVLVQHEPYTAFIYTTCLTQYILSKLIFK